MTEPEVRVTRSDYDAVIFDMDGVITKTAKVHFRAWKKLFDQYLDKRHPTEKPFKEKDYLRYVDGKPRLEGIESFLESRNITLPRGSEQDSPDTETIYGLGNRKNRYFNELIKKDGVKVYDPALQVIKDLRSAGFKTAVITSSKNCVTVLEAAGIRHLFDHKIDGVDAREQNLKGKPQPDIFLAAAEKLGSRPERTVVLEDAVSGVQAGKKGGFALVIGVDRAGQRENLLKNGAHIVLKDLSYIQVINSSSDSPPVPSALDRFQEIQARLISATAAVFLDYDGTLTPIVDDPDKAYLPEDMKETLTRLADLVPVAVISGRDRPDVQKLVELNNIYYAGSHGFDIAGPDQEETNPDKVTEFLPELDQADSEIRKRIEHIEGAWVEKKKFSIAVHYRKVKEKDTPRVKQAVEKVSGNHSRLKLSGGKKVFELRPNMDWHKGKALLWVLDKLELNKSGVVPLYIGDDVTDEDAFQTLEGRGISIVVMDSRRETKADYMLKSPDEVRLFLEKIISADKGNN
ncbi:MAG: trehalose-phosphatase [Desulfonatronovibrio sp.]